VSLFALNVWWCVNTTIPGGVFASTILIQKTALPLCIRDHRPRSSENLVSIEWINSMLIRKPSSAPIPKPPKHLQPATRKWFADVVQAYELEEHHIRLLTLASEAWDRGVAAREAIAANGMTYNDRYGCPHPRPEIAIENTARIGFARLIRELDLDVTEPATPSRPPALKSNRRV
jgi:phage terminase small subunit